MNDGVAKPQLIKPFSFRCVCQRCVRVCVCVEGPFVRADFIFGPIGMDV